jgi:hypothetical protein
VSFRYSAFGLCLYSHLSLPGLSEGSGEADIRIERGRTAGSLPGENKPSLFVTVSSGCCLQEIPGHGRILITSDKIVVEHFPGADEDLLALFLLRSSLGILMQLRGCLVLRGAAVEIGGRAAIISCVCNGASTLAATLVTKGAKLISDELCVVTLNNEGQPQLIPYYPAVSLRKSMATELELLPESPRPIRKTLEKYLIPLPEFFSSSPVLVSSLFLLTVHSKPDAALRFITGNTKMQALMEHTSSKRLIDGLGLKQTYFKIAFPFSHHCKIGLLHRPARGDSREVLAQIVEENL